MSADNVMIVRENKDRSYDVGEYFTGGALIKKIGHFTNLRDAMCAAEEYAQNDVIGVEYNARFIPYQGKE